MINVKILTLKDCLQIYLLKGENLSVLTSSHGQMLKIMWFILRFIEKFLYNILNQSFVLEFFVALQIFRKLLRV